MNYDYLTLSYPVLILGALSITFILTPILLYFTKGPKKEEKMDQETYNNIQLKRAKLKKERLIFKYDESTKNIELNGNGRTLEKILGLAVELFSRDDDLKNDEALIYAAAKSWLERPLYNIKGLEGLTPYEIFEEEKEEKLIKWLRDMNWEEGEMTPTKNRKPVEMKLLPQTKDMR